MSKALDSQIAKITNKWDSLPPRDKLALILLSLFLFIIFGVYGGWRVHQESTKQQSLYEDKLTDFFWLRSQSSNLKNQMNGQDIGNQPLNIQLNQLLQSSGVQAQVAGSNETVQFSFNHSSQAIISKVISDIQNNGWNLTTLSIERLQEGQDFSIQGTITTSN